MRSQHAKNKPETGAGLKGVKLVRKNPNVYYTGADKANSSSDGVGGGGIGLFEVIGKDVVEGINQWVVVEEIAVATRKGTSLRRQQGHNSQVLTTFFVEFGWFAWNAFRFCDVYSSWSFFNFFMVESPYCCGCKLLAWLCAC